MKALLWIAALFLLLFTACSPTPQPTPPPPLPTPTPADPGQPSPTDGPQPENTPTPGSGSESTATLAADTSTPPIPTHTPSPVPATGTVTGRTLLGGNPVPDIQVKLDDGSTFVTSTGADGSFTLAGVPAGSHTIFARATGVGSSTLEVFVTPNETFVQDLILFVFLELTAHPPEPTPQENAPEGGAISWSGSWVLNFGTMKLIQSGKEVSGSYHNNFTDASGTISGIVSGNGFKGTWKNDRKSGALHWVLAAHGDSFNGNFNGSSAWCGARPGKPFPEGCSFSGNWVSVMDNQKCPLKLTRSDDLVKGTFCGGSISGKISYPGGSNDTWLNGTWKSKASGPFRLILLGYDALQFQGNWNERNPWCGWRADLKEPAPCPR